MHSWVHVDKFFNKLWLKGSWFYSDSPPPFKQFTGNKEGGGERGQFQRSHVMGLGKPQHREPLSAVGQGGRQAYAQRRWPWFELQEIRSWELAIKNSQPVNPFRARGGNGGRGWTRNNFFCPVTSILDSVHVGSSHTACADTRISLQHECSHPELKI